MAIGIALPIEPEGPLIKRSRASRPACAHWPNSPPSATSVAPRSSHGCTAAQTASGCIGVAALRRHSFHAGGVAARVRATSSAQPVAAGLGAAAVS